MNNVMFHKKATSQLSCICKIVKKKLFPECGYGDLNGVVSVLKRFWRPDPVVGNGWNRFDSEG